MNLSKTKILPNTFQNLKKSHLIVQKTIHQFYFQQDLQEVIVIIENEIAKRYKKNWEAEIKEVQNRESIRTGRRIDFKILVNDKVIDTLYINKIECLRINVVNQRKVTGYIKRDILATISFAKGRKLVSQYENVKSENIESILKNEFKIKSIDEIDRIVIEFSNIYYSLGLYVYPIK